MSFRTLFLTSGITPVNIGAPLGEAFGSINHISGYDFILAITEPATASGIITSIEMNSGHTGTANVRFLVGSISGNNFTVRSKSASTQLISGTNTYTGFSLDVEAGDVIGYWSSSGGVRARYDSNSGRSLGYAPTVPTEPNVSTIISFSTDSNSQMAIRGTG